VLRGFALRGFCAWAGAEAARRGGQVALEVILGFKKDAIDDALLTRCREAFRVWLLGLFSVPLDLPGFCAPCAAGSRAGWLQQMLPPRASPCCAAAVFALCGAGPPARTQETESVRPAVRSVPPGAQGRQAAARHPAQQPPAPEGRGGAPRVRTPAHPPPLCCAPCTAQSPEHCCSTSQFIPCRVIPAHWPTERCPACSAAPVRAHLHVPQRFRLSCSSQSQSVQRMVKGAGNDQRMLPKRLRLRLRPAAPLRAQGGRRGRRRGAAAHLCAEPARRPRRRRAAAVHGPAERAPAQRARPCMRLPMHVQR